MNLEHIEDTINIAKIMGAYTKIKITASGLTYCNLFRINNENHILHIPDDIILFPAQADYRKILRRLNGKLKIIGGKGLKSTNSMLSHVAFDEIDLTELDTTNVTTMQSMFKTSNIRKIIFGNMEMGKVEDMSEMFNRAIIETVDMRNLDVSNVVNLNHAFSLSNIDNVILSGLNFNNVATAERMFYCSAIKNLDLSNIKMPNIENIGFMFSLLDTPELDVRSLNFDNVKDATCIFSDLYKTRIKIKKSQFDKVRHYEGALSNCENIEVH